MESERGAGGELAASREYEDVEYLQFRPSPVLRWTMVVLGVLSWPLILPLALLSRVSDFVFRTCAEGFSLVPYFPGVILRYEFYRFSLRGCGRNVLVEFGAVFVVRDVQVGSNVLIGRFTIVHQCDIGNFVLIGERCTFLGGSRQHSFARTDVPMALQGGQKRRISIGDDCWIGSHAVVMDDVATGSVVAAAAVVTQPVPSRAIVGGIPAKILGSRQ